MTRANANPELPGHLPGAGKTRSKVNRSRSAAGAGLGAQRRGRIARIEVGTSGSLARPPAAPPDAGVAARLRRRQLPPLPSAPFMAARPRRAVRSRRRSREPAPALTSAARAAIRSYCKLSRAARTAPSSE